MNSYNENLQNTVAAALQSQNLDLKSLESQFTSAMYTLYYAEGATITAEEKLGVATIDMQHKAEIKGQAVKNMSISANQLNSATQAANFNGQAVTNMGTCAANVQIAATAITRVAADIGGIFSIVNAADYGTDIYNLTNQVQGLVNTTAYNAESVSQTAMEASAYTAQVTAATVLNDAKATNALMSNLLQIAAGDYNTAAQTVAADNATVASVSTNEKLAEGAFKSADIDLVTGQSAYYSVNLGLNLGLTSIPLSSDTFLVAFNRLKAAFPPPPPHDRSAPPSTTAGSGTAGDQLYPVAQYHVFVVKESKQLTFSIADAENIIMNNPNRFVTVSTSAQTSEIVLKDPGMIARVIDVNAVPGSTGSYQLKDTDGDGIAAGDSYVTFMMAVFQDPYKRLINNFNDFLSAPTLPFALTTQLNAADNVSFITVGDLTDDGQATPDAGPETKTTLKNLAEANVDIQPVVADAQKQEANYIMFFQAASPDDAKVNMGCNCIYLPVMIDVPESLLTQSEIDLFINDQVSIDGIRLQNEKQIIQQCIDGLRASQNPKPSKQKGADNADKGTSQTSDDVPDYIKLLDVKLSQLRSKDENKRTRFVFNVDLAEIVPAGSYTPATAIASPAGNKNQTSPNWWFAFIGPATTDNFGNLLIPKTAYAAAILTLSNSDNQLIADAYTSNISDFANVALFTPGKHKVITN